MIAIASWLKPGLAAGLCAIAATVYTNPSIRGLDGALLAGWMLLAYVAAAFAAGSAHALVLRFSLARTEGPSAPAIQLGAVLSAGGIGAAVIATDGIGSPAVRALLVTALAAGVLALAVPVALRFPTRALAATSRFSSSALLVVGTLAALGTLTGLGLRLPSDGDTAQPLKDGAPPVLLIGIDGADWKRLDPLIAADRLPNIALLVRNGTRGPLRTLTPTWSPRIWTSIVTGLPPEQHGILDFFEFRLPGQICGAQRLETRLGVAPLTPPSTGGRPILAVFKRMALLSPLPVTNCGRRAQSIWNLVSDGGGRVGVVSWWGSWPSEPVAGAMIADLNPYRSGLVSWNEDISAPLLGVTHPPDLLSSLERVELPELPTTAEAIVALPFFASLPPEQRAEFLLKREALTSFFPNILRSDSFAGSSMEALLQREHFDFSAVHLAAIDEVSHRWAKYPGLVDAAYEWVDSWVGRIVAATPTGTIVVLVSDHGWIYEQDTEQDGGHVGHNDAPDGIFAIRGPGIASARLEAAPHVLDVAPTLLALLGIAADERMPGTAIQAALPSAAATASRMPRLRYAERRATTAAGSGEAPELGDGMTDRLRALGYLDE